MIGNETVEHSHMVRLSLARIKCATLGLHLLKIVEINSTTSGKILEYIKNIEQIMELKLLQEYKEYR